MQLGALEIVPVHDGSFRVPADGLLNRAPHADWLDDDGLLQIDLGGYLVRADGRLLLIDLGMGPVDEPNGQLLNSLARLGLAPADITDVLLTHLHFDHIGWAGDGKGGAMFPNATYRCHAADWDWFVGPDAHPDEFRFPGMPGAEDLLAPIADRVETWTGEETIARGVDVRPAPGHTPGSSLVVLSSGAERAVLLGDVIHCPGELVEDEWTMVADVDPVLAAQTREALARELDGSDALIGAAHLPGLRFGRLLPGRSWTYALR